MNRMKIRQWKFLTFICMMIMLFPLSVSAASAGDASGFEIHYPEADADIVIYRIANYKGDGHYDMCSPFDEYVDKIRFLEEAEQNLDDLSTSTLMQLAVTLKTYVIADGLPPDFWVITDFNGDVVIPDIEQGLYLVFGEKIEMNGTIYTASPILIAITEDVSLSDENLKLDFSSKIAPLNINGECRVLKIWKDDGNEGYRPEEIGVTLYKDGTVYDQKILSEDNNWEYMWTNLEVGPEWIVAEDNIPDDYKVSYELGINYIAVENEYSSDEPEEPETPDNPDEPEKPETPDTSGGKNPSGGRLPQTGQLWWPVPILAILGIGFFTVGWIKRNRGER